MNRKRIPDFLKPCRSVRSNRMGNNQYLAYQQLAAVYLLRLALGKQKQLNRQNIKEFFEGDLGKLTGLAHCEAVVDKFDLEPFEDLFGQDDDEEIPTPKIKISKVQLLKHMHQHLSLLMEDGFSTTEPLFQNLSLLAKTLKLSLAEQEILVLRLLMPLIDTYRLAVIEHCDQCTPQATVSYLQMMTLRPKLEIEKALRPSGQLVQMGWLKIRSGMVDLEDKLKLADGLLDILLQKHDDSADLFAHFFKASSCTELVLDDYAHLQHDLDVVLPYLKAALAARRAGTNILIYGPPGVGKTQFAKLLAQTLNTPLYEVLCADKDGRALRGSARFAACSLSQKLLSKNRNSSLLLFDEAEDVFPGRLSFLDDEDDEEIKASSHGDKAWINQQLESNAVPMIWITNRTDGIDKAFLRRFQYSIEIDKMPTAIRRRIVNKYSKGLKVTAHWKEKLASQADLTPAQIEQACSVAKTAQKQAPATTEQIAERVLAASMRLLRQKNTLAKTVSWTQYDRAFTNTDLNLEALLSGLKRNPRGTFCFYGAPGTGKTALARHISETVGLPLHIKRSSQLLDMYVGGSEKNIAKMFADAEKQGAILLLDEADSLLGDRSHARQQWEITQVNEMLTQMESFSGMFICTTNLMAKLDEASLRRFDFKVKFDYLSAEQRWALFEQESSRLGSALPDNPETLAALKQQINRLTKLTPGDFAVVGRQVVVLGHTPEPERIIAVLEQECKAKGESFQKIGFVH